MAYFDWTRLNDSYYRKVEIYNMSWDIDLTMYLSSAASYGGPIALVRNPELLVRATRHKAGHDILIYSPAGEKLATINWDLEKKGQIVKLLWTDEIDLVVVSEKGVVYLFDIHGSSKDSFKLGAEVDKVLDCKGWGTGLVVLTGDFRFYSIINFYDKRPRAMGRIPYMDGPPSSWSVVDPRFTADYQPALIVAFGSHIYTVDNATATQQPCEIATYTEMGISPNGGFVALFNSDGKLSVWSSDFQESLSETQTKTKYPPSQLVWCGGDSVVAHWTGIVLMIGPVAPWEQFNYDYPVLLVPEIDGVRIIGSELHEFLQKLPASVEDVFKVGSTEPSACLFDAVKLFQERNARADELVRSLKDDMAIAVESCIEAAGHEFDPGLQKQLLKAASFGKCFVDSFDSDIYTNMCRTLRVLNAIRFYIIGIPLTYAQYQELTPEVVINRLIQRNHHCLAYKICEYLNMDASNILVHWACAKIRHASPDDTICEAIVDKLKDPKLTDTRGVSFSTIARTAYLSGKSDLAIRLLNFEPRAGEQVPLLIELDESELALDKAIDSGDTDLVNYAIIHLESKHSYGDFLHIVQSKPVACSLYIQWCKAHGERDKLRDFYKQDDQFMEQAFLKVEDAYRSEVPTVKNESLRIAKGQFSEIKGSQFYWKATEDQLKLRTLQQKLLHRLNKNFADLSVADTISKLILEGCFKDAEGVKNEYKVTDKKFWWIKLRALAYREQWDTLHAFSESTRRSPIGYEPFVEECMMYNNPREAARYVSRCPPEKQITYYCKTGFYEEAVKTAVRMKDIEALNYVKKVASARHDIKALADRGIAQISS